MACFIAPATVAVVTTVVRKVVQKKENTYTDRPVGAGSSESAGKWTKRLGWLNNMLWGGVVMLVLDHLLNGELVPWPPFLTALDTPGQVGPLLREIAVVGGGMTAAVFVVWGVMILVIEARQRARRVREA